MFRLQLNQLSRRIIFSVHFKKRILYTHVRKHRFNITFLHPYASKLPRLCSTFVAYTYSLRNKRVLNRFAVVSQNHNRPEMNEKKKKMYSQNIRILFCTRLPNRNPSVDQSSLSSASRSGKADSWNTLRSQNRISRSNTCIWLG